MYFESELIFETIGFLDFNSLGFPKGWSHCQLPSTFSSNASVQNVYFASRNEEQRSSIYKIEMSLHGSEVSFNLDEFNREPILEPGKIGHFDSDGVFHLVFSNTTMSFIFTIGWLKGSQTPYFTLTSISLEKFQGVFEKLSPLLH